MKVINNELREQMRRKQVNQKAKNYYHSAIKERTVICETCMKEMGEAYYHKHHVKSNLHAKYAALEIGN